ncbi:MAG: TlpA disulfide reductase family protein [Chromatiales bacterium]|nr:TlpA disulfide reductase family protein [Chromatiales bacterium]
MNDRHLQTETNPDETNPDDDTGRRTWIVVLTAIVVTLATALGVGLYGYLGRDTAPAQAAVNPESPFEHLLGQRRPALALADLEGNTRDIDEWDGQVVLVNFWATWCPPCRREMPTFVEMQERHGERGLTIVAVAIDRLEPVLDFVDGYGINFPVLIGSTDASQVMQHYGNRFGALPFSVVLDRQGRIRYVQPGEITERIFDEQVLPLL